jgi:hypothetical protein
MEDPDVVKRRKERDPRVDDFGFIRKRWDYDALFSAQDRFIAANSFSTDMPETFYDACSTMIEYLDPFGNSLPHCADYPATRLELQVYKLVSAHPNKLRRKFFDLQALKPYLGWVSTERIKQCLDNTTQHYKQVIHYPFRKHLKSRFPAANVPRLNEWMATDTYFNDTPALDDGIPGHGGSTMFQVFVGLKSRILDGNPMKLETQVPDAFEDIIHRTSAPLGLMSDQAKSEMHG